MVGTPCNALNITQAGVVSFDGVATFTGSPLTQYNTLVGGASNAIVNISTGTAGQVLTSGGSSANPSYQTLPYTAEPWTDEATNFNAVANHGYFVTATCIATLPASPAQGSVCSFAVDSASGILTIQANTGQTIQIGQDLSATAGVTVSHDDGDSIVLYYRAADTNWMAITAPQGTWTTT